MPESTPTLLRLPEGVLRRATRIAARLVPGGGAYVAAVASHDAIQLLAAWPEDARVAHGPLPLRKDGPSVTGEVVRTGAPVVLEDLAAVAEHSAFAPAYALGMRALVAVPIQAGEGPARGALVVYTTEPRVWSAEERQTLADLAAMVASETLLAETQRAMDLARATHLVALDRSTDAFFLLDAAGRVAYVNARADALLDLVHGAPRAAAVGQAFGAVLPAAGQPDVQAALDAAAANQPVGMQEVYDEPTGLWLEFHAFPHDEGVAVYCRDVTARLRVEQERERLAQSLRHLLDATQDGIYGVDTAGRCTFINAAGAALLGYAVDELVGRHFHAVAHHTRLDGSPYPVEACPVQRAARGASGGDAVATGREVFWRKDGSPLSVEITANPIVEQGRTTGAVAVFRDVTERQRTEEALHEREEYFRAITEHGRDVIGIIDVMGVVRYMSPAVQRVLGYDPGALEGQSLFPLVHPDDQATAQDALERVLGAPRNVVSVTYRVRHARDEWRHMEATCTNLLDHPSIRGVVVNARDVTEQRNAEAALHDSQQQFLQAQKMEAVGRLAGGVAHDFNNLLTIIGSYAALGHKSLQDGDPLKEFMKQILEAADRSTALTRQLLAFSRKQIVQPKVLEVGAVVQNMDKLLRRLIGEDVELTTALDPAAGQVRVDPGQLEQVLMNLAVNARDAMPHGGHLRIDAAARRVDEAFLRAHPHLTPDTYVVLSVADTGVGMDAGTQQRIFEPFFTTKEQGKGTGLGLSTVYGIVRQAGGTIVVTSRPEKGTRFDIYLPQVAGPVPVDPGLVAAAPARAGGTETILVVEDEEALRQLIKIILRQQGYTVLDAANAGEALMVCEGYRDHIHLMLTDIVMPRMTGIELTLRLRDLRPDMRVMYMSGYTDDGTNALSQIDWEYDLLQKPFTPPVLLDRVRAALIRPAP